MNQNNSQSYSKKKGIKTLLLSLSSYDLTSNLQSYSKKKGIKTLLLRLSSYDLTSNLQIFPSKIWSLNSWKIAQLSKMLLRISLWPSNGLSIMLCHQSFLVQCLSSTYWKLLAFLESIWSVFNSKAASRVPLIIFIALMVSRVWPW